jgi:hypothetical protein
MINLNIFYRLKKSTQGNFFQVGTPLTKKCLITIIIIIININKTRTLQVSGIRLSSKNIRDRNARIIVE